METDRLITEDRTAPGGRRASHRCQLDPGHDGLALCFRTVCNSAWSQVTDGNHLGSALLNADGQVSLVGTLGPWDLV